MTTTQTKEEIPFEREKLHAILLENPNYFGTLLKTDPFAAKFKPVKVLKKGDTSYEELTCIGYNPEIQTLTGIVKINLNKGYNGGPCTPGSREYVRFFIDYHNGSGWHDLGIRSFNIHDIAHTHENPLDFAVNLLFVPKLEHCCFEKPVLPTVKGILSWDVLPPAGNHGYIPVWGNILDVNIQIIPSNSIACLLKKGLTNIGVDITKEKAATLSALLPAASVDEDALKENALATKEEVPLADLVKAYGQSVEHERTGFTAVANALSFESVDATPLYTELDTAGLDISKIMAFINKPKFNTTYEEIKCVGLNIDASLLNATINVKKSLGFGGGLCSKGSREYVAFYMDFQDGAGWRYVGTSSVGVHDIKPLPDGGLSYNVELPVNLLHFEKQSCKEVYLAKVKAILSWNMLPPAHHPNWVAPWGNWMESWVEIKNRFIFPGERKPYILAIGTLPANKINGFTGLVDKTLGIPDATVDAYDGYSLNGSISLSGIITTPPDSNNIPGAQMKYKIMLKKASQPDSAFAPVTGIFKVLKTVISGGIPVQNVVAQVNNSDYYNYLVDYTLPTIVSVSGDLLGELLLPDSDVYEFYIETDGGLKTSRYRVKNDIHVPDNVHIHIDGGQDCGTLKQGNPVTGTYSLADMENNCLGVSFGILFFPPGTSSALAVDGVARSFGSIIPVPGIGKNGVWSITTDKLTPCGYNFRMYAYDKTVLCYHTLSYAYGIRDQYTYDTLGFCLAKP